MPVSRLLGAAVLGFVLLTSGGLLADTATVAQNPKHDPVVVAAHAGMPAISYVKSVKPLLKEKCYACHGNGTKLGGLSLDTKAGMLSGGTSGPAAVVGHSDKSLIIKLVSGGDPARIMPARGPRLSDPEIGLLRAWVDGGMQVDASEADSWQPILAPREPRVPPIAPNGAVNPIDRLLLSYHKSHHVLPPPLVDDRTFARRAYLDLIGVIPAPEEITSFLHDRRPDKRARLAETLLADTRRYTQHWITFWNDMLRNDYTGTGYIDGGRMQITDWLYRALAGNMPYDRFVSELVNPTRDSEGFTRGIVWRGVVNASQTPEMQAAQNISQVFMGVNLKCASCHNSFVSTWKLADCYGMASIYADKPLELVRCDRPTGEMAQLKFIYPQLGKIDPSAPRPERLRQLAEAITSPRDGRLARTLVNRIWSRLLGRGLVEPLDEMDNRPWSPDVLDWISWDFAKHGYDVKHLLEQIVTSRAYQEPSVGLPSERNEGFVFRGPVVKRMSAEQYVDAISTLTGVWEQPAQGFQVVRGKPAIPQDGRSAIRFETPVMRKAESMPVDVDITGATVLALIVTDGGDGADFDWADWVNPTLIGPKGETKLTDLKWYSASVGYGKIQIDKSIVEKPLRLADHTYTNGIGTHANSMISYILPPGYTRFRALAGPDAGAIESKGSKTSLAMFVITGDRTMLEARSALSASNKLTRALGRPNRDQVVTERQTAATTLQALELTNGETLNAMLVQGAGRWVDTPGITPERVVNGIFEEALGRLPTATERIQGMAVIGPTVKREGVEDLLWSVVMLPEFQLIY